MDFPRHLAAPGDPGTASKPPSMTLPPEQKQATLFVY